MRHLGSDDVCMIACTLGGGYISIEEFVSSQAMYLGRRLKNMAQQAHADAGPLFTPSTPRVSHKFDRVGG